MTALDIVTAYSVIPGREDVALFLGEAMRGEGWQDNKLSLKRHTLNEKLKHSERRQADRLAIQRILDLDGQWWGQNDDDSSEEPSEEEKDIEDVEFYVCNISSFLLVELMRTHLDTTIGLFFHARLLSCLPPSVV